MMKSILPSTPRNRAVLLASSALAIALTLAVPESANAQGLPTGGIVSAGAATIAQSPTVTTITQSSQAAAINWDSFNIALGKSVAFVQPNGSAVALNRVAGADPSTILGNLTANGQVFLVNPNGVLFGRDAHVDVGGFVASTLGLSDADLMAGRYRFAGTSDAAVINRGTITAGSGGYVALLGATVDNQGILSAKLGTVALAGGDRITLDLAGDGLLNVTVDTGAARALVSNGGMIKADGGRVLLTTQGAGELLQTAVNNSGVIQARTIENRGGTILLLADMQNGKLTLTGSLDASASAGGDGGFIETSAAQVNIAGSARVTTEAAAGKTGTWLIDPQDFTISEEGNISGADLSALLVTNNVTISTEPVSDETVAGTPPTTYYGTTVVGNGDIQVLEAIAWTASGNATTLRLNAARDVNINAAITATNGNVVACCGRDVNVNAPVTTTNGSILLNAGRNVNVYHVLTATDGNIALCAGHDVHIEDAITITRGTTIPAQSLGLAPGLLIIVGADGSGPGVENGVLDVAPGTPPITVTATDVVIDYNPVSYELATDFSDYFTLTEGAQIDAYMLLFPEAGKVEDGTATATFTGFKGSPVGDVTLVAGTGSSATYAQSGPGSDIAITYSGYTLGGADAGQYALAGSCCVNSFATTGTITAAATSTPTPTPAPGSSPSPIPGEPGFVPTPGVWTPSAPLPSSGTLLEKEHAAFVLPLAPISQIASRNVLGSGIAMPAAQLETVQPVIESPAPAIVPDAAPTPAPATPAPKIYVPKQDRN